MATKTIYTRIKNKVANLSDWKTATGTLLDGEIAIVRVPTGEAYMNPVTGKEEPIIELLMKVGDGDKTFEELPWLSAKASDVYDWAKAETVAVEAIAENGATKEFLVFRDAQGNEIAGARVDLSKFALASEVGVLTGRIAAVESKFSGNNSVEGQIAGLDARLVALEGDEENDGVIAAGDKDTLASAQSYANGKASEAETNAKNAVIGAADDVKTADTVYGAKAFATDLNSAMDSRVGTLEGTVAGHTTAIGNNATAISNEATARENADNAINAKFGTEYSANNTVATAIADAKQAGLDAANTVQSNVDTLSGTVSQNTADISTNAGNIAKVEGLVNAEVSRSTGIDANHETRISKMEAFFVGAAEDEVEGEKLKNALDTLKEIQDFATGEGTAAQEMLDTISGLNTRLSTAEGDIDSLEGRASAVEGRMTAAEGTITALSGDMTQAKSDIANLGNTKLDASVYNSYIAGKSMSDEDLKSYTDSKANDAQSAAESTAAGALAAAVGTINGKIAALEGADTVLDGKISTNATNIQTNATNITNEETARKAADDLINAKFGANYSETSTVASAIADAKQTGDDAQGTANANAGRLSVIESDYLKATDVFIFDCGGAPEAETTTE